MAFFTYKSWSQIPKDFHKLQNRQVNRTIVSIKEIEIDEGYPSWIMAKIYESREMRKIP